MHYSKVSKKSVANAECCTGWQAFRNKCARANHFHNAAKVQKKHAVDYAGNANNCSINSFVLKSLSTLINSAWELKSPGRNRVRSRVIDFLKSTIRWNFAVQPGRNPGMVHTAIAPTAAFPMETMTLPCAMLNLCLWYEVRIFDVKIIALLPHLTSVSVFQKTKRICFC